MQNTRAHDGGSCGRYNHPDIIITENGVCLPGEADAALPGVLNDVKRIEFLRDYVQSAMQAMKVDKVCMHCSNFGEKPTKTKFSIRAATCGRRGDAGGGCTQVKVLGYYIWSVYDNWEWAASSSDSFGIVHVNITGDLTRYYKASSQWVSRWFSGHS